MRRGDPDPRRGVHGFQQVCSGAGQRGRSCARLMIRLFARRENQLPTVDDGGKRARLTEESTK
jgi:hypothetical protein